MGKGFVGRGIALAVIGAFFAVAPLAGISAAQTGGSGDDEVVATLTIDADNVSVQKAGKDNFKPAKNGQKLRQGDTVKTDATGKAEIDYSDAGDSYTRLDVNTTFTIVKLTEEQGERQIEGSLEEGRTWNRTQAITESGSFEQSGGGATAAVTGTAFPVDCTIAAPDCVFTGVEGTFILKGNGEDRTVTPYQQCGSTDGDLCDEVRTLTADEMAAILWIQENLLEDLVERGLGTGPIIPNFTVVVEDGVVVDVIQETPPPPATEPTTTTKPKSTTTTTVPPAIGGDPINISSGGVGDPNSNLPPFTVPTGPANEIVTEDEVDDDFPVTFTINVTGQSGHVLKIKFTEIPGTSYGTLEWSADGVTNWQQILPANEDTTLYDGTSTFRFVPMQYEAPGSPEDCQTEVTVPSSDFDDCFGAGTTYPQPVTPGLDGGGQPDGTVEWTTHFSVVAVDMTTGQESTPTSIPITIVDDVCGESTNDTGKCVVATSTTTTSTTLIIT